MNVINVCIIWNKKLSHVCVYFVGDYQVPNLKRKSQLSSYSKGRRQHFNSINEIEPPENEYRRKLWANTNSIVEKRRKRNRRRNGTKFIKVYIHDLYRI